MGISKIMLVMILNIGNLQDVLVMSLNTGMSVSCTETLKAHISLT